MPLISLQVSTDIAEKIRFMAESGVFALETGNVQLNCVEGKIKSIKTERYTYPKLSTTQETTVDIVKIATIL